MDPITLVGITGAAVILTFFLLNQFHKISNDSFLYDSGNFIGAALLLAYSLLISNFLFATINSIWALFSLKDTVLHLKRKNP